MTLKIFIFDVRPTDFAKWKPLWDGYNEFYGRKGDTALPDEITNLTWSRFFDGYEPIHALVAEHAGKLAGCVIHFSSQHHQPHQQLLSSGFVHRRISRRQGIGRALIEEVYRRAEQAGSARVYWQTHETNAHRHEALRQSRRKIRLHHLSQRSVKKFCEKIP